MFPRRARLPLAISAGLLLLVGIGALAWWLANRGDSPTPTSSPTPEAAASPTLTAAPVDPQLRPGEVIATIAGEELEVFDEPGGTRTMTLDQWSEATFQPLTLLAVEEREVDGTLWLRVMLPVQPNQSTGWIRADDVTTATTHVQIRIYIEERELELWDGEELLLTAPVALGTPETPTPPGLYSITDPLDSTHNDTGVYGAYALGLSGFSEVLKDFNGAPPQLAIHGTNEPDLIGQYVSNGCIRLHNEDVLTVVEHTGLGTPVHIYASRADSE
jgi:lipoprotein-anchoring transpeptidase ErfK/SrfK